MNLRKSLAFLFVSALALLWLVPIIMMLVVSLMPPEQRAPRFGGLLISGVSLKNYVTVFLDAPILQHFVNSIAVTVPSVILVVMISSLAAFALARLKFFARDLWFYLLIMTLMLPIPTLVVPIFPNQQGAGTYRQLPGLDTALYGAGRALRHCDSAQFLRGIPARVGRSRHPGRLHALRNLLAHHDASELAPPWRWLSSGSL